MPSEDSDQASVGLSAGEAAEAPAAEGAACAPLGPDGEPIPWEKWEGRIPAFPDDIPLHGLMLSATRLLGAYGQQTVQAAGLNVSLAGLGVLRILMARDGLKATELAAEAWSSPGTVTSVVNTLVKSGFAERRPDDADRRVVRLYITDQGRALISYYVPQAAARWQRALDFVGEADEAVVRGFFIQLINHLSQLMREERGR
jgi:DNA-binding MarR family transcriptional regulator